MLKHAVTLVGRGRAEQHPVEKPVEAPLAPEALRLVPKPLGQRRATEILLAGKEHGGPDCVGQRIAGGRVEKSAHDADATGFAVRPEAIEVAAQSHRKNAFFLALDCRVSPASRLQISLDAVPQSEDVELAALRIISVLDQQTLVVEWQAVDEPVAVNLFDRGVHDDRPLEAMALFHPAIAADEFLPGEVEGTALS